MFKGIKRAYGAGYRAGLCNAKADCNPFTMRRQIVLNYAWFSGWHDGMTKSLNAWLYSRKP